MANISLLSAQNMIGDVPGVVNRATEQVDQRNPTGGSIGDKINRSLALTISDRKASRFLDAFAQQEDKSYQNFIKQAARTGVVNNPRVLAYSEILKEGANWENVKKGVAMEKENEQAQYDLGQERETGKTGIINDLVEQVMTAEPENVTKGLSLFSTAYRTMSNTTGNEDKLTTDEYKLAADLINTRIKERTEEENRAKLQEETNASKEKMKADELRAKAVQRAREERDKSNPTISPDVTANEAIQAAQQVKLASDKVAEADDPKKGISPEERAIRIRALDDARDKERYWNLRQQEFASLAGRGKNRQSDLGTAEVSAQQKANIDNINIRMPALRAALKNVSKKSDPMAELQKQGFGDYFSTTDETNQRVLFKKGKLAYVLRSDYGAWDDYLKGKTNTLPSYSPGVSSGSVGGSASSTPDKYKQIAVAKQYVSDYDAGKKIDANGDPMSESRYNAAKALIGK